MAVLNGSPKTKKIAIVGSGISGIGVLYALRHSHHEIHLFEKENRLGGHTNTVTWKHRGRKIPVDTGFIVMNDATYPNFLAFLRELNIDTVPTAMTFGVCRNEGEFEWAGTNLEGIFAQRENAVSARFWRMIFDIVRFNQFALDLLTDVDGTLEDDNDQTIGDYLRRNGYSDAFRDDYIIPMTACVWSTGPDKCALEFPAVTLVRFMWNHHLLSTVSKRPDWRTIMGGSKQYIDAVLRDFRPKHVHLSSGVKSLENTPDGRVVLTLDNGKKDIFDDVVLACHGDTARDIISSSATEAEKSIMSAFYTTPNQAYLHSDLSLMPRRRPAWSAWNYLTTTRPKPRHSLSPKTSNAGALSTVSLTYNMNILQHIPAADYNHVLVTMNPPHQPAPALTQAVMAYRHPLYTVAAVRSQLRLPEIQGKRGIWFAGSWTGYGFHEDGFRSGIEVGIELGGSVPWELVQTRFIRGRRPVLAWRDYLLRIFILGVQMCILWVQSFAALARGIRRGERTTKMKAR